MTKAERETAADAIALSKEHADRADAAEDTLNAIREVLTRFDWENGVDRLALEEIDRIAFGGQS